MNSWKQRNQSLAPLPLSCARDLVLGQLPLALECWLLSVCQSSPFHPSPKRKAHIFGLKPEVTLDSWESRVSQRKPSPLHGQLSTRELCSATMISWEPVLSPQTIMASQDSPATPELRVIKGTTPSLIMCVSCTSSQPLFWLESKLPSVPETDGLLDSSIHPLTPGSHWTKSFPWSLTIPHLLNVHNSNGGWADSVGAARAKTLAHLK